MNAVRAVDTTPAGLTYEDLPVGRVVVCDERQVTAADLDAVAGLCVGRLRNGRQPDAELPAAGRSRPVVDHGYAMTVLWSALHDGLLRSQAVRSVDGIEWRCPAAVSVGDILRLTMTVIGRRRSTGGENGSVALHLRLHDQHRTTVGEGVVRLTLTAGDTDIDSESRAFATLAWGETLARRLNEDSRFTTALADWDGSVGLRCDTSEVHLRLYRGRVIDTTRRSVHGATFTVEAPGLVWTELLVGPVNDFARRAMAGQITVHGDGYEYLRLIKPMHVLVDVARELAAQDGR